MGIVASINSIERRFAWSFAGFLIGAVSFAVAILIFYITRNESRTDLKLIVEDEVNLVEIREELPKLRLLYDDQDILKADKEIRLLRFTLQNDGQTILQNYYDTTQPFGVAFHDSIILGVSLTDANSDYLRENLYSKTETATNDAASISGPHSAVLSLQKTIIERGKFAKFKVFLLQKKSEARTHIEPFGKIAGLDSIPVIRRDMSHGEARAPVPANRIVTWLVIGYFGFLFFLIAFIVFVEWILQLGRNRRAKRFVATHSDLTDEQRSLVESFRIGWPSIYERIIRRIAKGDEVVDISQLVTDKLNSRPLSFPMNVLFPKRFTDRLLRLSLVPLKPAVFSSEGYKVTLNPTNRDLLIKLIASDDDAD